MAISVSVVLEGNAAAALEAVDDSAVQPPVAAGSRIVRSGFGWTILT